MTNKESRLKAAKNYLNMVAVTLKKAEEMAVEAIKDVLRPCNGGWCPIGTEDYAEDIYYVYAEPIENEFRRVKAIKYDVPTDTLYLCVEFEDENEAKRCKAVVGSNKDWSCGGWIIPFKQAFISDLHFLVDEVEANIEYAEGYYAE